MSRALCAVRIAVRKAVPIALLVCAGGVVISPSAAVAQDQAAPKALTMYKCGNRLQDRPCDPGTSAKGGSGAVPLSGGSGESALKSAARARDQQRQIRCENYGRQRADIIDRRKQDPDTASQYDAQLRSLEARIKADGCSA